MPQPKQLRCTSATIGLTQSELIPFFQMGFMKYKIHQMLSHETKQKLSTHVTSVLILMKSANSVIELRRLVQRQYGVEQLNLFDGWDVK
ncbi:MAG: hypothetical protein RMZ43_019570 [Nostoc sp. CmiVER01]|uniref:hypothetical protein n=1 Tax=Nostoc sp. CmiVER01 TaxID=3075384 RepID=UPI003D161861